MRARVMILKPLASIATLGTGGAGGREGPTMQMGGAIGAFVGRLLPTTERERSIVFVANETTRVSFRAPASIRSARPFAAA